MENMKHFECCTKHPTQNSSKNGLRAQMEIEGFEMKLFLACLPTSQQSILTGLKSHLPPCTLSTTDHPHPCI